MKPRTVKDLPPVWLLTVAGPPGLVYAHSRHATRSAATREFRRWEKVHHKQTRYPAAESNFRPVQGVVRDAPEVPLCADLHYVRSPADLTMRENWIARNGPLLVEAEHRVRDAVVFTWKPGRSKDPLRPRARGPAPVPNNVKEWPRCARCQTPMLYVGTLDFRETPARRHVPGDALTLFYCDRCGLDDVSIRHFWLFARRRQLLLQPPQGQPQCSHLGTPWLVRDFAWDDVERFWQLAGITNTVAGRSFYTTVTVCGFKAGGHIFWIQSDETPRCACRRKMRFVGQVFAIGDDFDFGDSGLGYVFVCAQRRCDDTRTVIQCF